MKQNILGLFLLSIFVVGGVWAGVANAQTFSQSNNQEIHRQIQVLMKMVEDLQNLFNQMRQGKDSSVLKPVNQVLPPKGQQCTDDMFTCPSGVLVPRTSPGCQFICPTASSTPILPPKVVCTMEAKLCSDGSSVGRSGPKCEFEQCPAITPIKCSKEEMLCPNGKVVGRTGPKCEFAACTISSAVPVLCPMDKYICMDGSMVGASGPNCEYNCPSVNPTY